MSSVGEKLKQRRQSLSLTQQQVADELGVTVTTVKNWEAGRHIPKLYLEQTKALWVFALLWFPVLCCSLPVDNCRYTDKEY
jgi:putative transcriptional regulator